MAAAQYQYAKEPVAVALAVKQLKLCVDKKSMLQDSAI
jgi:hypothetical protein